MPSVKQEPVFTPWWKIVGFSALFFQVYLAFSDPNVISLGEKQLAFYLVVLWLGMFLLARLFTNQFWWLVLNEKPEKRGR